MVLFLALVCLALGVASGISHRNLRQPEALGDPTKLSTSELVGHYCNNVGVFANGHDFGVASSLYRAFLENQEHSVFFVVGVHNGSDIKNLIQQKWWDKTKAKIVGWEALNANYDLASKTLQDNGEVTIIHGAVSDKEETLSVSGDDVYAGVYPSSKRWKDAHQKVNASRWYDFVRSEDIPEVSYALIDVEGHEMAVIHGMNLEKMKTTFPVFQYELGGTWGNDPRHTGTMTQEDAARYLESLGYSIFLMGEKDGEPLLAPMTPEAFAEARSCCEYKQNPVVHGNALAVLREALPQRPWLKDAVSEMLKRDKQLK